MDKKFLQTLISSSIFALLILPVGQAAKGSEACKASECPACRCYMRYQGSDQTQFCDSAAGSQICPTYSWMDATKACKEFCKVSQHCHQQYASIYGEGRCDSK